MEQTVVLSGLSCESCNTLIGRLAAKNGVTMAQADWASGRYTFSSESPAQIGLLLEKLDQMGYSSSGKSARHRRLFSAFKSLLFGELRAEREMLYASLFAVLISLGLQLGMFSFLGQRAFLSSALPFIVLADVSVAAAAFSVWHFFSLRAKIPCMTGMMVGMTIGMVSGFLIGYSFGATNGMFVGSLVGMAAGIALGAWAGSCCGVMGAMEGVMAGLMSGTMGAMLSVMMLNDNLLPFSGIFLLACLSILGMLFYMLNKEFGAVREGDDDELAAAAIVVASLLLSLVAYAAPKAALAFK